MDRQVDRKTIKVNCSRLFYSRYNIRIINFLLDIMAKVKLFKVNTMEDGTERFQTQLEIGRDTCNFVRGKDGKMKQWGWKEEKGHGFHEYEGEFEIVENIEDMRMQEL